MLLCSAPSQAEIVKYYFTAKGYDLTYGPPCTRYSCTPPEAYGNHHLGTVLNPTSTITGSFFYDTDLKGVSPYVSNGVSSDSYIDFNGIGSSFTSDTGYHYANNATTVNKTPHISVVDEPIGSHYISDYMSIFTWQDDSYGASEGLEFNFISKVGNGIFSDASLPTALSLDNFNGKVSLFWAHPGGAYQFFYANMTSLTMTPPAPVPEPATYAMLGLGLACLAAAKRRQRRQAV